MAAPILLRRRPLTVEAMRVEANNLYLVATWCGGVLAEGKGVWVTTDTGAPLMAEIGQWLIRGPRNNFYPSPEDSLWAAYEAPIGDTP